MAYPAFFGDLRVSIISLNSNDLHIAGLIRTSITISSHAPLTAMAASFFQMPAVLPNLQPFPIWQTPWNAAIDCSGALLAKTPI